MKLHYFSIFLFFIALACKPIKKEQPITKAEAITYAKDIELSFKKGDKNTLNRVLDEDLFADEVAKASDQKNNNSLKAGVKKGLERQNLSKEVFNSLGEDGTYQFVKQYEKDGHQHIIFRLYGNDGLNYHDFELVKYDGKIRAKDIYIYLTGENLSSTMAQIVSIMVKNTDNGNDNSKDQPEKMVMLRSLYQQNKLEEAKALFDQLPAKIRKEKVFQLMNIQITANMADTIYAAALAEFENLHGNDASIQLALFDGYFIRKDYDRALKVIDQIDKTVQDPLLDYYRALLHTQKNNNAEALKHLERLENNMPHFEAGILELLATYMEQKQYDKAQKLLLTYKENKDFNQDRLNDLKTLYPDAAEKLSW